MSDGWNRRKGKEVRAGMRKRAKRIEELKEVRQKENGRKSNKTFSGDF